MKADPKAVLETIMRLRKSALQHGMEELAITYGWSAIRLGNEILAELEANHGQNPR